MGLGVFYAVITGLMWAAGGALLSRVLRRGKDPVAFVALSSFVTVPALWLLVPDYAVIRGSDEIPRLAELILYMALGGFSVGLAQLALQAAMKRGHQGATWTINNAALALPFVAGVVFWDDQPGVSNFVGVGMILGALVCLGLATERDEHTGRKKLQVGWFLLAMTAFVFTGMELIAKSMPNWKGIVDVGELRAPLTLSASAIVFQIVAISGRRYTRDAPWKEAVAMGCLMVPSHFLIYKALDIFAEAKLTGLGYPMAVCACLLGFVVYSIVVLKEKLTFLRGVGLVLGFVGVVLVPITTDSWQALWQAMKGWLA
jgi:uncharacterized membrane protein